jgi:Tfp pilus assembly protein PilZ
MSSAFAVRAWLCLGKESRIMTYTTDQIEKHTIVARLSVSIYRMNDEQLMTILNLLENEDDMAAASNIHPSDKDSDSDAPLAHRQMIIARIFILINQLDRDSLLQRLRPFQHPDFRWVREYPRLPCYIQVDFAAGGKAYRSCIRDISAGGVFIETGDSFKPGQDIALCFSLAESDAALPFKLKGKVMRVYPDGIGVQYVNMSKYQRDIINTLIEKS